MVSRASFALSVSIAIGLMLSINHLRFPFDNVRIVVDLFMLFGTVSDYNVFALLNVSDIKDNVIVNMAFIMMLLLRSLVALIVFLVMTMRTAVISVAEMMTTRIGSTMDKSSREDKDQEFHFVIFGDNFPPY